MDDSIIQQVKIQARVLVPLVRALQTELGEQRANALVRRAFGAIYRRYGEKFWLAKNEKKTSGRLWALSWPRLPATTLSIIG